MEEVEVAVEAKIEDGLLVINSVGIPALFNNENSMRVIIQMVRDEVAKHPLDLETAKGRTARKSLAHTVSKSKVLLDGLGGDLVSDIKSKVKVVDGIRKVARDELDALRDEVKAPVLEWERLEEIRIDKVQKILSNLSEVISRQFVSVDDAKQILEMVNEIEIGEEMGEFEDQAEVMVQSALDNVGKEIDRLVQQEADQAELDQLRKDKEERESAEAEAQRVADKKVADDLAEKKRLEREEQIRIEEQEKAEQEALQQQADFEKEKDRLIKEERHRVQKIEDDRIAAEQVEAAKAEKKAANKRHQAHVHKQILHDLVGNVSIEDETAKAIIRAIAHGKIANVTISY